MREGDRSTSPPKVLVLMAARNGSKWITEQIDTILNQADVRIDLVVSDDGSTDDTPQKVAEYLPGGRVRLQSQPTPTGSAAQNFLWLLRNVPVGDHGFVALADQDDLWHEEKVSRGCRSLIDAGAAGYSCATTAFWSNGREVTLRPANTTTNADFMFESAGQGCTYLFTADFYRQLQAFFLEHTRLTTGLAFHDWAVYALARAWKHNWYFDQRPMMRYRQHGGNDTGARASYSGVKKRLGMIRDGWYSAQLDTIAQISLSANPSDATILEWNRLLAKPRGMARRYKIAMFCLGAGRRRFLDNMILLAAAVMGWV